MFQIFLTAFGLSMDACAASVAMGARFKHLMLRLLGLSLLFGVFQAGMPLLGYALGAPFERFIAPVDHWIAFAILCLLGLNMIFDWQKENEIEESAKKLSWKVMFSLAFATSIDAFVVGIGMSAMQWPLLISVLMIGGVTLAFSVLGVFVGRRFGAFLSGYAEKFGGVVLIFLGCKILFSHLFF
jgi:putative Mn2+ efflux pump MntP